MKLEVFKKSLDIIRDFDTTINDIENLKINIIDSNICNSFWSLQRILLSEIYGKEGYEWIDYYLYEIPLMIETRKNKNEEIPDFWAKDSKGKPIDLSSDDSLWNFLEKEYGKK